MLLFFFLLVLSSTARFCFLWDTNCLTKYFEVTAAFSLVKRIADLDMAAGFCATFNGNTLNRVAYYNPVICVFHKGEPNEEYARSLYVNYSRHGRVVEADTKNLSVEIPNFEECLWQYRNYVYEVQLTFSRLIKISDLPLLNRLLGYNTSEFGPFNQTLNCFNPLWDISNDQWEEICSIGRYHIDYSRIPADEVQRIMGKLIIFTNLTIKSLSDCTEEAKRIQNRDFNIQYAVIGCISSVLLIGVVLCIAHLRNKLEEDAPDLGLPPPYHERVPLVPDQSPGDFLYRDV